MFSNFFIQVYCKKIKNFIFILISILFVSINLICQVAIDPKLMLPLGHIGKIQFASFSSDGSRVLSTAYDGEYDTQVLVWDLETREIIHVINTDQGTDLGEETYYGLESAFFSPSGKKIITVGASSTKFWDTETGNLLSEINDYEHFATCANKEMVLARSSFGDTTSIKIWDTETQEIVNELTGDFNIEEDIFFGCDTKSVIFVSNAKIYLWDFMENKVHETLTESEKKENFRVLEANSKTLICSAHNDSHFEICYFTLPKLELVKSITYHYDYTYNYYLINENKELLLYTQNEELNLFEAFIYDFQSGDLIFETRITKDSFNSFLIEKKYHSNSTKLNQLLHYQLERNNTVYFNEERSLIFLPDVDGTNVYNVESGEFLYSISSEPSEAYDFVLNCNGNKFLTFNEYSPRIEIRDVFSGRQIMSLTGRINPIKASRFDYQGKHLWIWDGLNTRLWDIENSKFVYSINFQKRVRAFSFSKNNLFVACRMPESIMVLDFYSGQLISEINLSMSGFGTVAFSDDGSRIVTSDGESVVKLWDTITGKLLSEYGTMGLNFFNAEFSPDSKFIAATSSDLKSKKRKKRKNQEEDEVFKQYFFDISNGKMKGSVVGGVVNFDSWNEWIITQNYGEFDLYDYYLLWDLKTYKFIDTINFSDDSTSLWRLISSQFQSNKKFNYFEKYDGKYRTKGEILSINRSRNLIVTKHNNILHFYSLSPDTLIYSMVLANQTDYLILHPDGYFDGTEVSRNLVYFVCNGEIIDLAQMKDALYIPGLADMIIKGKTINYPTKLSDLGICDALPVIARRQEETYSYSIIPRRLPLERVEVYINEKVIFNFFASQLSFDGTSYGLVLDEKDIGKHLLIGKENEVKIIGVVKELGSELRTRGLVVPAIKEFR